MIEYSLKAAALEALCSFLCCSEVNTGVQRGLGVPRRPVCQHFVAARESLTVVDSRTARVLLSLCACTSASANVSTSSSTSVCASTSTSASVNSSVSAGASARTSTSASSSASAGASARTSASASTSVSTSVSASVCANVTTSASVQQEIKTRPADFLCVVQHLSQLVCSWRPAQAQRAPLALLAGV